MNTHAAYQIAVQRNVRRRSLVSSLEEGKLCSGIGPIGENYGNIRLYRVYNNDTPHFKTVIFTLTGLNYFTPFHMS